MKKKRRLSKLTFYISIITCMFLLTACMKTDLDEAPTHENTGNQPSNPTAESMIENIDITASHCQLRLKDKFLIDADITPYDVYGAGLGLYNYRNDYDDFTDEVFDKFIANVDEYFGKDITITRDEALEMENESKDPNLHVSSNIQMEVKNFRRELSFFNTDVADSVQDSLNHLQAHDMQYMYPFTSRTGNMELIDAGIDSVFKMLDGIIDLTKYTHKQILHYDTPFYDRLEKICEKAGMDWASCFDYFAFSKRESYYLIRLTPELDNNLKFDWIKYISPRFILGDKFESATISGKNYVSYIDIALTEDGRLIGFDVCDRSEPDDEPFAHMNIVDVRKVLESMYSRYKNTYLFNEITVTEVYLAYSIGLDKEDDGTYRTCAKPYWIINYLGETMNGVLSYSNCTYIYDAITGRIIVDGYGRIGNGNDKI